MPPVPPTRSSFVTVMAALSLATAALGVLSGLLQALMLATMPGDAITQALQAAGPPVPPRLQWALAHLQALNLASTLLSALVLLLSWGLLQRREWGRRGFIAILVAGALACLAGLPLFGHLLDWSRQLSGADATDPLLLQFHAAMRTAMTMAAIAVAVLHGAIAWMLCTPRIRAEFA